MEKLIPFLILLSSVVLLGTGFIVGGLSFILGSYFGSWSARNRLNANQYKPVLIQRQANTADDFERIAAASAVNPFYDKNQYSGDAGTFQGPIPQHVMKARVPSGV